MISIKHFNSMNDRDAYVALERCCGSTAWIKAMLSLRPFDSADTLANQADRVWQSLSEADWIEAFSHHPKIGDIGSLRKKFAATRQWAEGEQKGVRQASDIILDQLADGNDAYEKTFGYIFIVCATGKSAGEMLQLLQARLPNDAGREIRIAAEEQRKITRIRLAKLLGNI